MSARKTVSEPNFPSPESTSKTDVGGGLRMFLGRGLGAHRGSNGKENRFPIKLMMLSIRKLRAIKQRASARRPVGVVSVVQCRCRSLVAELRVAVGANYRLIASWRKKQQTCCHPSYPCQRAVFKRFCLLPLDTGPVVGRPCAKMHEKCAEPSVD